MTSVSGRRTPQDRFRRLICALSWHRPTTPEWRATRCDRCGALIEWDDNGGWRYA